MDEQRNNPKNLMSQIAIETAASGGGILTQLAMGAGVATTVTGGVTPPIISALVRATRAVIRQRQNSAATTLHTAAEWVGGLDILEQRVYSHDQRVELLARVLDAAARTTTPREKFRALSRVLVDGLEDDADMGEAFILAGALADMEAPHIEVLIHINAQPIPRPEIHPHDVDEPPLGWEANYLARALPKLAEILDGLVAVLTRHGLLIDVGRANYPGNVGAAILTISRLGSRVLFLLSEETDRLSRLTKDDH